jgi:hypothetical protein
MSGWPDINLADGGLEQVDVQAIQEMLEGSAPVISPNPLDNVGWLTTK